ncbi:MAG: hypothetical protein Q7S42_05160 [Candidatus Omnitrophota bacterium]|nr:hypothetical protein [Candidatus Omnitrophota bacterium]
MGRRSQALFKADIDFDSDIDLSIEAKNKNILIGHEDDILRAFKERSWNYIPRNMLFCVLVSMFLGVIVMILMEKIVNKDFFMGTFGFVGVYVGIALFLTNFLSAKLYPALVITENNRFSGRIFKKDFWKFIMGIITCIIAPILVDIIKKHFVR